MIPGSFPVLLAPASGGYVIEGSGLWGGSAGDVLARTLGTPSNSRKFTARFVFKLGSLGTSRDLASANTTSTARCELQVQASGALLFYMASAGGTSVNLTTTALLRDPAAYYDVVFIYDTALATAADRVKIYVNGTRLTDFATETLPAQNLVSANWNTAQVHQIGQRASNSERNFDGYMALAMNIDGQALDPTSFGEVTDDGFWQINDVSELTFGNNGFLLEGGEYIASGGYTADRIPTMSSATNPSGVVTSNGDLSSGDANWKAFDNSSSTKWASATQNTGFLGYQFTSSKIIKRYTIEARTATGAAMPKNFTFQGGYSGGATYTITVQSVGGNNKYFVNGVQQDTLELFEGNTYIFNYPSGHPFKFSTTSNGTHGGGSEYTTGVTHNSGTQVTIVVATGAPTLYYYCSSHSGMGGTANTPAEWVVLDTQTNETFSGGEIRGYDIPNTTAYTKYKIVVTVIGSAGEYPTIQEMTMHEQEDWVVNGIAFGKTGTITATSDSPTDDSTNEYGNYATWNPLVLTDGALSNGNLTTTTTSAVQLLLGSTLATPLSGTFWVEGTIDDRGNHVNNPASGWRDNTNPADYPYNSSGWYGTKFAYIQGDGDLVTPSGTSSTFVPAFVDGDMWGWAVDIDNKAMYFAYKPASGSWTWANSATVQEIEAGNTTNAAYTWTGDNTFLHSIAAYSSSGTCAVTTNFGATAWNDDTFQPTGFVGLATQNLPVPAVANYENEYYIEGGISHSNGSTTAVTLPKSVSGGAMVRIKRTNTTGDWYVFDTVRGPNKSLLWNTTGIEDTSTFSDQNLTGTTLTLPSALATGTYMIECHYVGSYFQITAYTGNATARAISFPSALDTVPGFYAITSRDSATGWYAKHKGYAATKWLECNTSSALQTGSTIFNNTEATASQFTVGTSTATNKNYDNMLCYAWSDSGPYSWGSYNGNASADGPMVHMDGYPANYFAKHTSSGESWWNIPTVITTNDVNPVNNRLRLDTTAAPSVSSSMIWDILSNGVKIRSTNPAYNTNNALYVYGAFGVQPIQGNGKDTAQGRSK